MWQYLKQSFVLNVLLFAAVVGMSIAAFGAVREMLVVRSELRHMQQEIEREAAAQDALRASLVRADTPLALEREAKRHLNLRYPGEEVVVVVPGEEELASEAAPTPLLKRVWVFIQSLFARDGQSVY